MKKKKTKSIKELFKRPHPTERFSFETSHSYWTEIANNLENWVDVLKKELYKVNEILPDSHTYWTISSNLADAESIAKEVREFVDEITFGPDFNKKVQDLVDKYENNSNQ